MMTSKKTACLLGYLGLLPFVIPAIAIWFLSEEIAIAMQISQMVYAALIVSFLGGVQWGYAVRRGDDAKSWQYIISVCPTLLMSLLQMFVGVIQPFQLFLVFIGLLIVQAIIDHKVITEKWFVKLRWILVVFAGLSLLSTALFNYV